jgi:hypothetical protein
LGVQQPRERGCEVSGRFPSRLGIGAIRIAVVFQKFQNPKLAKAESDDDLRGSIVALREVRGCIESLG